MSSPTDKLVSYLYGLRFEDLPKPVVDRAKLVLMDTLGCCMGGSKTAIAEAAGPVVRHTAGQGRSTIIGFSNPVDGVSAAYFNAMLADALDYEDTLIAHPSATVVPAALAVGEMVGAAGRDVLTAIVAGYEVGVRVARSVYPSKERGAEIPIHYSWTAFGAVAAAAKLLKLEPDQIRDALAYTGGSTPVPLWISKWPRPLHWIKNNFAEQARTGVWAALLGQAGFLGPRDILENEYGFWRMLGSDRLDTSQLDAGLGVRYELLNTTFKPYPACRWIHPALDALSEIKEQHHIAAADVETIVVRSFSEMVDWFNEPRPHSIVDAEFSVPYVLAVSLMGIAPGPQWYAEETLRDEAVLSLSSRVQLERLPEAERLFYDERRYLAELELRLSGGKTIKARCDVPRGSLQRPLTDGEMKDKFVMLADSFGLAAEDASGLWDTGFGLEALSDIAQLMRGLRTEDTDPRR